MKLRQPPRHNGVRCQLLPVGLPPGDKSEERADLPTLFVSGEGFFMPVARLQLYGLKEAEL